MQLSKNPTFIIIGLSIIFIACVFIGTTAFNHFNGVEGSYPHKLSSKDVKYLAITIYKEANKESTNGKEGVAYVVLNRSLSNYNYGSKSIVGIITAKHQFSWTSHFNFDTDSNKIDWKQYIPMVNRIVDTYHIKNSPVKDATHFVNVDNATSNKWWEKDRMQLITKIGNHTFLKVADEVVAMPKD